MASPVQLLAPDTIDEGTCLLRDDGLPKINETEGSIAAFFSYSTGREHLKSDGPDEESYRVFLLDNIRPAVGGIEIASYFPEIDTSTTKTVIQVAIFNECAIDIAEKIIDATGGGTGAQGSASAQVSSDLLGSKHLKRSGNFMTGISLRAKSRPDSLKLFSAFPYLGYRTHQAPGSASQPAPATSQSLKLNEYRSKILGDPVIGSGGFSEILVHQAWFLLINGENVAVFKSKEDKLSIRAPLFQYQQRLGIFHGLVQMISNTLTTSETAVLKRIYEEIPQQESFIRSEMKKVISSDSKRNIENINKLISDFEDSLDNISNMTRVVQTQIELLQDLREIFQSPFGEDKKVGKPRPHRNVVNIPFIVDAPEEMRVAVETIDAIVTERETVRAGLSILLNDFKHSRVFSFQANQESFEKMQLMEKHLKNQGQTITFFTFITTAFLPLGFFSQYFAIVFPTSVTRNEFWSISGPVTSVMIVLLSLFMFVPDDKIKRWFTEPVMGLFRSKKSQKSRATGLPK